MQIIVWKDKHGDYFYDASTPEAKEASALKILGELVHQRYIFEPEDPMKHIEYSGIDMDLANLTDEQIDDLPAESMKKTARMNKQRLAGRIREYENEKREYETVLKLVAGKDVFTYRTSHVDHPDGKYKKGDRLEAKVTAWSILQMRSGYEYETFSLENVWTPEESKA